MPDIRMHLVDVFARERYAGNQLAVFLETASMSADEMQRITRETNFSEATFVPSTDRRDGGYDVRIFDPAEEIPFAGHPTLGTAFVLREYVRDDAPDELRLNLGVGQLPVWVEGGGSTETYWMRQVSPTWGDTFDRSLFARILRLDEADIDPAYPVQLVSTGLRTVVVPLRTLDAVRRASTALEPYYEGLIEPHGNLNVLVFAPESYEGHDLNARVFADCAGVPEDPATGSSNGCLAAYLVRHEYLGGGPIDVDVEQGYELDRPSLLHLRAARTDDDIEVEVGGRVIPTATGRLL